MHAEGRTATAFRALGRDMTVVFPEPGSFVAYAEVPGGVVTAGEPVGPPERLVPVVEAFAAQYTLQDIARHTAQHITQHAGQQRRRVTFFATEGRLMQSRRLDRWLIGEQPVWDPREWAMHLRTHRSLREQLRRAKAKGVVSHRIDAACVMQPEWRAAFDALIRRWHATRSMPAMRFLVDVDLTAGWPWRRTYVAIRDNRLAGLLSMAPVPARRGWLLEHLLRDPDAPNGTAELLVDHAMRDLSAEHAPWATLGLAPLHGPIAPWLTTVRRLSRPLFNFMGLSAFKRKLRPTSWEPILMAWPREQAGWRALWDSLRAFAGGPLWRFGVRTIGRGPAPLLQLLEWLLIPWTLLLAFAPTSPWFPSPHVHAAWVVFDAALVLALRRLRLESSRRGVEARRRAAQLATGLALAVSGDAMLTMTEALVWNVPHRLGPGGWTLLLVACLAPALTAPVLWGASRRLRILATMPPTCPAPEPTP